MKLVISLSYYSPHISGLTLSIKRLAELLASNNYQVTILAAQHEKKLPLKEEIQRVAVVRAPYLLRVGKNFVMPRFSLIAFKLLKENDAVMITLPQAQSIVVALLAKILGKKIYCLYICEVILPGRWTSKLINWGVGVVNRITLLFADEIITLSQDFAQYNNALKHKKVHGIYPVIIPPKVSGSERDTLLKKLPKKRYSIGYLGRIASEKGLNYLLEAIPALQKNLGNDFIIILAGPKKTVGEENYKKQIEALLKTYPEFVIQLGELSDQQLGAFYSLLDVFVLPSTNNTEAFGMVQVEAMYCGTPVVATNLPGVRVPILETGMGEIVETKNTQKLAEAIVKVLENKKKYVKPAATIEEIFSVEKILKEYKKIFNFS